MVTSGLATMRPERQYLSIYDETTRCRTNSSSIQRGDFQARWRTTSSDQRTWHPERTAPGPPPTGLRRWGCTEPKELLLQFLPQCRRFVRRWVSAACRGSDRATRLVRTAGATIVRDHVPERHGSDILAHYFKRTRRMT